MLSHQLQYQDKFLEVIRFGCLQRICLEERNYDLAQILSTSYTIPVDVLPVIVMATVHEDIATGEELLKLFENMETLRSLRDHELWKYLPSQSHSGVAVERNGEGSFSVNEPDNPTSGCCSFLLIVCARHIVTIVNEASDGSDPGKQ